MPCIAGPGGVVHQPALYDFVLTIVVLVILLRLRKTARYDGFLIIVFGVLYGLNRFIEDWFRIDVTHGLGLTGSQWTALAAMVVCRRLVGLRVTARRVGVAGTSCGTSWRCLLPSGLRCRPRRLRRRAPETEE